MARAPIPKRQIARQSTARAYGATGYEEGRPQPPGPSGATLGQQFVQSALAGFKKLTGQRPHTAAENESFKQRGKRAYYEGSKSKTRGLVG